MQFLLYDQVSVRSYAVWAVPCEASTLENIKKTSALGFLRFALEDEMGFLRLGEDAKWTYG